MTFAVAALAAVIVVAVFSTVLVEVAYRKVRAINDRAIQHRRIADEAGVGEGG